ncbi:MAG: class I SAM-dependent methyltransferase [Kiritimatiellae bacterium]|nr:class I SAM-dependent methyltransferase [Kiritimatiellia bacterium]
MGPMIAGEPQAVPPDRRRRRWPTPATVDAIRRWRYWPLDLWEALTGRRPPLMPPRRLRFVGESDFEATGREFLELFVRYGGLTPTDRVLDVGCGIGRMAIPLATVLRPPGHYLGFDIVRAGIHWCQRNISARFPHMQFVHADVFNWHYNPKGRIRAEAYRFPCPDGDRSFVVLTSVFTHMLRPAVEHYLDEIARVLRPGGRCFATFFLLTPESEAVIERGGGQVRFAERFGEDRVVSREDPEGAIAFPERYVRGAFERRGLRIRDPIPYGRWADRDGPTLQDIVVAVNEGPSAAISG